MASIPNLFGPLFKSGLPEAIVSHVLKSTALPGHLPEQSRIYMKPGRNSIHKVRGPGRMRLSETGHFRDDFTHNFAGSTTDGDQPCVTESP